MRSIRSWRTSTPATDSTPAPADTKPAVPEPVQTTPPRRLDYRVTGWGHSYELDPTDRTTEDETSIFRGYCFYRFGLRVGDELLMRTRSGRTWIFRLTSVDRLRDPHDMHWIEGYPTGYLEDEQEAAAAV